MHIRIPIKAVKTSTNKIYAGKHWTYRAAIKENVHTLTRLYARGIAPLESYPVVISYRFVFGSRALDTLNTAFMAKMFEDALRSVQILKDDDYRYVRESRLTVEKAEKGKEDYVEINIQPWTSNQ